jgi:hypothetical protein
MQSKIDKIVRDWLRGFINPEDAMREIALISKNRKLVREA